MMSRTDGIIINGITADDISEIHHLRRDVNELRERERGAAKQFGDLASDLHSVLADLAAVKQWQATWGFILGGGILAVFAAVLSLIVRR